MPEKTTAYYAGTQTLPTNVMHLKVTISFTRPEKGSKSIPWLFQCKGTAFGACSINIGAEKRLQCSKHPLEGCGT